VTTGCTNQVWPLRQMKGVFAPITAQSLWTRTGLLLATRERKCAPPSGLDGSGHCGGKSPVQAARWAVPSGAGVNGSPLLKTMGPGKGLAAAVN
jgi:hypothetical protein